MKVKVYSCIADVPTECWEDLVQGHSHAYSRAFWEVLEHAGMPDFDFRYAVFFDSRDRAVGFATFYTVVTDIAIFAPPALRATLGFIRRLFPKFLKLHVLECGTPITVSSPPFGVEPSVDMHEFTEALCSLLLRTARKQHQLIVVVRDFEDPAADCRRRFEQLGFRSVPSLPNTYLDVRWSTPQAYLDAMRSYYRSKLMRHLRRNADAGVRHELVEEFHDLADTLCAQWQIVHDRAVEFQRERLTPQFYRALSTKLGSRSKALLFYRHDQLVGHALLLLDGDMLRWLYVGRNEALNDGLYIYIAHKVVETAILLGAKRLEMGLTTYPVKQDLGARVAPNHVVLKSSLAIVNPFVAYFYGVLNRTPKIADKAIFKIDDAQRTPTIRRKRNR